MLSGKHNQMAAQRVLQISEHKGLIATKTGLHESMHEQIVSASVTAQLYMLALHLHGRRRRPTRARDVN